MSVWVARSLVRIAARLIPDKLTRARYREQWLADVEGAAELGLRPVPIAAGALAAALTMPLLGVSDDAERRRIHLGILQLVSAFPYAWAMVGYVVTAREAGMWGPELFDLEPPISTGCGTSYGCLSEQPWGPMAFIEPQGSLASFPLLWIGINGWVVCAILVPFGVVAAIGGRGWSRWLPLVGTLAGVAASIFAQTDFASGLYQWLSRLLDYWY